MNCVSDEQAVINIQGIRYVTWGESHYTSAGNAGKPYFVSIQYKGNNTNIYYKTQAEAYSLFKKIRTAMDPKNNE